jgi:hypothetical protein
LLAPFAPLHKRPRTNGLLPLVRLEVLQLEAVQRWRHRCTSHLHLARPCPTPTSNLTTCPGWPHTVFVTFALLSSFSCSATLHCAVSKFHWLVGMLFALRDPSAQHCRHSCVARLHAAVLCLCSRDPRKKHERRHLHQLLGTAFRLETSLSSGRLC